MRTFATFDLAQDLIKQLELSPSAIVSPFYVDSHHLMPTHNWLTNTFLPKFEEWQKVEGIWQKWENKYDCNRYAEALFYFKTRCLRNTDIPDGEVAQALAIFRVLYSIEGIIGQGHAINVARTEKGWNFLEPQAASEIQLTKAEIDSIWCIY